jgi:Ca2+-binding EF-hand superfamily protein
MKNLLLGGAAAAAFVAIVPAIAQPAPPPPGVAEGTTVAPRLETRIHRMPKAETRNDAVAHAREMFGKLDTNRDGYVTKAEAEAAHQAMAGAMHEKFAKRLADGNFPHLDRGAMFDKLDSNKDGSITRQEFMAAQPRDKERHVMVMRDGDAPVAVDGGPGEQHVKIMRTHGVRGMHERMFEHADANRDGRVSLEEMTNAAIQHFDAADANHDGTLTPEERMQMHQRMKAAHDKPA